MGDLDKIQHAEFREAFDEFDKVGCCDICPPDKSPLTFVPLDKCSPRTTVPPEFVPLNNYPKVGVSLAPAGAPKARDGQHVSA